MFKVIKVYGVDCYINAFVKYRRKYYVVSDNGYECNIYKSDQQGEITDWFEIARVEKMLGEIVEDETNFSKFLPIK
jgi:hypothetical protein